MKSTKLLTKKLFCKNFFKIQFLKIFSFTITLKSSIKNFFQKKNKSIFQKLHIHFLSLFGQILFLAIILLFLFLLSVYFSQFNFLKKHSNNYKFNNFDLLYFDQINHDDFIFDRSLLNPSCKSLQSPSKFSIDYG